MVRTTQGRCFYGVRYRVIGLKAGEMSIFSVNLRQNNLCFQHGGNAAGLSQRIWGENQRSTTRGGAVHFPPQGPTGTHRVVEGNVVVWVHMKPQEKQVYS